MTSRISLTSQAHSVIEAHLNAGDIAIDATVGNGHDTLFLARQVGISGRVFGFDIQQQAIETTQSKLQSEQANENTQLFHLSHNKMEQCIPIDFHGKVKAIMFNLGYLPGSDKSIITQTDSTIAALEQSLNLLDKSGFIIIAAYPGHAGGKDETEAVRQWLERLASDQYDIKTIYSSEKDIAPRLYVIHPCQKKVLDCHISDHYV